MPNRGWSDACHVNYSKLLPTPYQMPVAMSRLLLPIRPVDDRTRERRVDVAKTCRGLSIHYLTAFLALYGLINVLLSQATARKALA